MNGRHITERIPDGQIEYHPLAWELKMAIHLLDDSSKLIMIDFPECDCPKPCLHFEVCKMEMLDHGLHKV